MVLPFWILNLIAYSLQIAILAAAGTLLVYLFRLRLPRVTLIYWQILLLACIFLPFLQRWDHPALDPVISGNGTVAVSAPYLAVPMNLKSPMQFPWEVIGIILAAGIVLRLAWLMLGFLRLHLFQRKSRMFLEDQASIRDMQWRTGVRVPLLLSDEIDSPVTFGFRSPRIILPLSFKNLSEPCQKAVLCHELLHVRRYDWILIVAEEVVGSFFWFHPGVWWLLNRIQLSREQAVDCEVVRLTGNKQPYLDSLLEFARSQGRPRAVPAPLFLKENHLVQRVALLIKEVSMSRSRLAVSMIGISVLLICTVRLAAGWFPLTGARLPAQEQRSDSQVKAPQRTPIRVGGNIMESKLIYKVDPIYPEQAKSIGLQGIVKLTTTVNEEGFVYELEVESGHPILVEAAIEAVKQWRYSPTLLNGEPVPTKATVTCIFGMKDTPAERQTIGIKPLVEATARLRPSTVVEVTSDRQAAAAPPPAQEQAVGLPIKAPLREPIRVGSMVQESKLIHRVEPVYPEQAKSIGLQGIVKLKITVNEEGFVYELEVEQGHPILVEAAIEAVKQWQYSPTLLNGEPVSAQTTVTVVFNLK